MLQNKYLPVILAITAVFISGCGSNRKGKFTAQQMETMRYPTRTGLPQASGGYTIKVGNETISTDDIISANAQNFAQSAKAAASYEQFSTDIKPLVQAMVINKISDLLLYQKARKSMPENFDQELLDKAVEDELRKFIASHGGNYSLAQKDVEQMGMDWKSFRDYQKRMLIVQSYLATESSETQPVTYQDTLNYYNAIKDKRFSSKPSYQFRLIDIDIDEIEVPDVNDPNQTPPTPQQLAMVKAQEIYQKAKAGHDFAQLAKKYSHGFAADKGGLWQPATKGSLAPPYDVIEPYIEKIGKNEIAGPIQSGSRIFIIQLEFKNPGGVVPFAKVQQRLTSELEFMRRKKMIDNMMNRFTSQVDLADINEFVDSIIKQAYLRFK